VEVFQELLPLLGLGLMRQRRYQEPAGDRVDGGVVRREDQGAFTGVAGEQPFERLQLAGGRPLQSLRLAVRPEGGSPLR
jgi:hypothetical protein